MRIAQETGDWAQVPVEGVEDAVEHIVLTTSINLR